MDTLIAVIFLLTAVVVVAVIFTVFRTAKKIEQQDADFTLIQDDVYTTNLASSREEEEKLVAEVIELGESIIQKIEEDIAVETIAKKKKSSKKKTAKKKTKKTKTSKAKKTKNEEF